MAGAFGELGTPELKKLTKLHRGLEQDLVELGPRIDKIDRINKIDRGGQRRFLSSITPHN